MDIAADIIAVLWLHPTGMHCHPVAMFGILVAYAPTSSSMCTQPTQKGLSTEYTPVKVFILQTQSSTPILSCLFNVFRPKRVEDLNAFSFMCLASCAEHV